MYKPTEYQKEKFNVEKALIKAKHYHEDMINAVLVEEELHDWLGENIATEIPITYKIYSMPYTFSLHLYIGEHYWDMQRSDFFQVMRTLQDKLGITFQRKQDESMATYFLGTTKPSFQFPGLRVFVNSKVPAKKQVKVSVGNV